MTDYCSAMAALLASTQAQEQAAAVLREAGWTVHAPGEVYWVSNGSDISLAIVGDEVRGNVFSPPMANGITADAWGDMPPMNRLARYPTEAAAKEAVEAALKGGAK
jgi:hypothetical protein